MPNVISNAELCKHTKPGDCWVIIDRTVWNLTQFLPNHPGGAAIILQYAGKDATAPYMKFHAAGTLEANLEVGDVMGVMENSWLPSVTREGKKDLKNQAERQKQKPPLYSLISSYDFEEVAKVHQPEQAVKYYASGAGDLRSLTMNRSLFDKSLFVPRVLRNMLDIQTECMILGQKSGVPFYISPAATRNMAHPEGEVCLARGAGASDMIYCMSTVATRTPEDVMAASPSGKSLFFQLYVSPDRKRSEALVRNVEKLGYKAIFVTVDTADRGKREGEEKWDIAHNLATGINKYDTNMRGPESLKLVFGIDRGFTWDDIAWIKGITNLPIVLKGIGSPGDARKAAEYGCQGIVLPIMAAEISIPANHP